MDIILNGPNISQHFQNQQIKYSTNWIIQQRNFITISYSFNFQKKFIFKFIKTLNKKKSVTKKKNEENAFINKKNE